MRTRVVIMLAVLLGLALWLALSSQPREQQLARTLAERPASPLSGLSTTAISPEAKQKALKAFQALPMSFVENPDDGPVKFFARANRYSIFLTPTKTVLAMLVPLETADAKTDVKKLDTGRHAVKPASKARGLKLLSSELVGANADATFEAEEETGCRSNYLYGSDPAKWRSDLRNFARVRQKNIYPGIDVVYYGNMRRLEYDFVIAPHADPAAISMAIQGADKVEKSPAGDLLLRLNKTTMVQHRPVAYQEIKGQRRPVNADFTLADDGRIAFQVGKYDPNHALVIDPVMVYGTYIGDDPVVLDQLSGFDGVLGTADDCLNFFDEGWAVAADAAGAAYVTGNTNSPSFKLINAITPFLNNFGVVPSFFTEPDDVFVVKLAANGQSGVFATWFGGAGDDSGRGIAVGSDGSVYITGRSQGNGFPVLNPPISGGGGPGDSFVAKLPPAGNTFTYAFEIGGSGTDNASGIAVDPQGNAYVTGTTDSPDFPMVRAFAAGAAYQGGATDAFVFKVTSTGGILAFSCYLGGAGADVGNGIATDSFGNAYVAGTTDSADFPLAAPFRNTLNGASDAFVSKFDPSGANLLFSTYLGGSGAETANGVAVDPQGQACVVGGTDSADFPTQNPTQGANAGGVDAYYTRFNSTGAGLTFSTYLGGGALDEAFAIAVDQDGYAYIAGDTSSTNFPLTINNSFQSSLGGGAGVDCFLAKFNPLSPTDATKTILYSTYLGSNALELGNGIAADANGNAVIVGSSQGGSFGSFGAYQRFDGEDVDAFAAKFADSAPRITSAKFVSGVRNQQFAYQIVATNTPLSYNASGLNAIGGLTINTASGAISGLPQNEGVFNVTISAENLAGTAILPLIISINSTAPQVSNQASAGQVGVPFTYRINATQNPTSYGASITAPVVATVNSIGLAIDALSGDLSGTPTAPGTYTLSLSATNNIGTGFGTLLLTINPAPPVITSSATATGTLGAPFQYIIAATNNPDSFTAVVMPGRAALSTIGLSLNATTGVITGTPTAAGGPTQIDMTASNAGGSSPIVSLQLTVDTKPVIQTPTTINGVVGTAITPAQIAGLNGPYTAGLYAGNNLPPGLSVNAAGQVVGTPTAAGIFNATVSATNAVPLTGSGNVLITINLPAPTITNSLVRTVPAGQAFSFDILATNTPQSYGATIVGSTNPAIAIGPVTNLGLTFNSTTGHIGGAASQVGVYTIRLTATNVTGTSTPADLMLTVTPALPSITSKVTDAAIINTPYTYTIVATGGPILGYGAMIISSSNSAVIPGPITSLGLAVNTTTGAITGTPTAAGIFTIQLSAINASGTGNADLVLTVTSAAPIITSSLLDTAVLNVPYSYTITAVGSPTIVFTAPELPKNGFSLSGSTISGTPTVLGTTTIAITASNGIAPADVRTLTINVVGSGVDVNDTDGDGFPDDLENAVGSSPTSAGSTPFGGKEAGTPTAINITQMQIKLNFKDAGKDTINIKGDLQVPATFEESSLPVTLVVGGIVSTYTLSDNGNGVSGDNKISLKAGKASGPNKTAKFSARLKGSFASELDDEFLVGTADVKDESVSVNVYLLFNDMLFQSNKLLSYSAKKGKSGTAKQPR